MIANQACAATKVQDRASSAGFKERFGHALRRWFRSLGYGDVVLRGKPSSGLFSIAVRASFSVSTWLSSTAVPASV